jgi:hypothetical protein
LVHRSRQAKSAFLDLPDSLLAEFLPEISMNRVFFFHSAAAYQER